MAITSSTTDAPPTTIPALMTRAALPKNASGKVLEDQLRATVQREGASA